MARLIIDDPATGNTAAELELAGPEEAIARAGAAVSAGRALASMSVTERITICEGFIARLEAGADRIAHDVTRQMGKPVTQARSEVATAISRARSMMSLAEECLADTELPGPVGFERRIQKVPIGVVLNIAAWNYPLLIPVNVVVPAVLAGNAVILKHSARTPLCAAHFAEAFAQAGAPEGTVVPLVTDHAVTAMLVARREVGYVAFTGSVEGGREVSRAARGREIDVGLELGGKDPAYVRADTDVAATAEAIAEGAFYNSGQSCCAVERVYVAREIYDEFVERLVDAAGPWRAGPPENEQTTLGPMAQRGAPAEISRQVEEAAARGARVLTGGSATTVASRGRYFEATVLADATDDMRVMREETFGPVAAVSPVGSDTEAIARMNDSPYGLTASIWTRDVDAARTIGARLEAGTIFLNRCDYLDPELPWSGWKDSGVGITLSRHGFDRMVRTRAYHFRLPT
ncbi:MAG: aldehyde dehydrogenase family protein [Candidatus Binatia bacterium]